MMTNVKPKYTQQIIIVTYQIFFSKINIFEYFLCSANDYTHVFGSQPSTGFLTPLIADCFTRYAGINIDSYANFQSLVLGKNVFIINTYSSI